MSQVTLLVIDDESQVRRFLRSALAPTDYKLLEADTGDRGLAAASAYHPDVILLDLGLPDLDGVDVTHRLREWTTTPIIILSARGQDKDKVAALDAGADDYLTKPFSLPELLARIRVAARHAEQRGDKKEAIFETGDLRIDLATRIVTLVGNEVRLTPIEYKLLATLVRKAGHVLTYHQLLKEVWGPRSLTHKQYLHVYMGHLRNKLEHDPAKPRFLVTEPGVGYRLRADCSVRVSLASIFSEHLVECCHPSS